MDLLRQGPKPLSPTLCGARAAYAYGRACGRHLRGALDERAAAALQVIFVDSCYFCAFDVLEMLVHSNANLVCAMDMVPSSSGAHRIALHRDHPSQSRRCMLLVACSARALPA